MTEIEALQSALAGEHAAVYGYGVSGAWLRGSGGAALDEARRGYEAHRARRDRLAALLADAGQVPVAAEPAYELPQPVRSPADARALALGVEERLGAVYADLVAAGASATRELAARAMQEAAVQAALWRGGSVAFPGLPER